MATFVDLPPEIILEILRLAHSIKPYPAAVEFISGLSPSRLLDSLLLDVALESLYFNFGFPDQRALFDALARDPTKAQYARHITFNLDGGLGAFTLGPFNNLRTVSAVLTASIRQLVPFAEAVRAAPWVTISQVQLSDVSTTFSYFCTNVLAPFSGLQINTLTLRAIMVENDGGEHHLSSVASPRIDMIDFASVDFPSVSLKSLLECSRCRRASFNLATAPDTPAFLPDDLLWLTWVSTDWPTKSLQPTALVPYLPGLPSLQNLTLLLRAGWLLPPFEWEAVFSAIPPSVTTFNLSLSADPFFRDVLHSFLRRADWLPHLKRLSIATKYLTSNGYADTERSLRSLRPSAAIYIGPLVAC